MSVDARSAERRSLTTSASAATDADAAVDVHLHVADAMAIVVRRVLDVPVVVRTIGRHLDVVQDRAATRILLFRVQR